MEIKDPRTHPNHRIPSDWAEISAQSKKKETFSVLGRSSFGTNILGVLTRALGVPIRDLGVLTRTQQLVRHSLNVYGGSIDVLGIREFFTSAPLTSPFTPPRAIRSPCYGKRVSDCRHSRRQSNQSAWTVCRGDFLGVLAVLCMTGTKSKAQ